MPGGSWRGSLACARYKQETVVRAAVEAAFEILAEKNYLGSNFGVEKLTELLNRCRKNVMDC